MSNENCSHHENWGDFYGGTREASSVQNHRLFFNIIMQFYGTVWQPKPFFYEKQRGRLVKLTLLKKYLCECMVWKIRFWLTLQRNPRSAPQSLRSVHTPKTLRYRMLDPAFQWIQFVHKFTGMEQHPNISCALDLSQVCREIYIRFTNLRYRRIDDMKCLMCFNLPQL